MSAPTPNHEVVERTLREILAEVGNRVQRPMLLEYLEHGEYGLAFEGLAYEFRRHPDWFSGQLIAKLRSAGEAIGLRI